MPRKGYQNKKYFAESLTRYKITLQEKEAMKHEKSMEF